MSSPSAPAAASAGSQNPMVINSSNNTEAPRTPERKASNDVEEHSAVTHVSSSSATPTAGRKLFNAADDSDSDFSNEPGSYADRELINKPLKRPHETFEPHPTDPELIKATFKIRIPDTDDFYIQEDLVPEKRAPIKSDIYGPKDTIFCPPLQKFKVPRKIKVRGTLVPWILSGDGKTWTRTHPETGDVATFTPNLFFRRLNALTHDYEKYFFGEAKLKNIDPNTDAWSGSYNKWIDQIARRTDANYIKEKKRDHWTVEELRAMYQGVNEHVRKKGIDSFASLSEADLKPIADAVNAAGGNNRGVDALRGQFNSSHIGKNPTIHRLRTEGPEVAQYLEDGGILADDERFPENVIPESEFPTAPRGNFIRNPSGNQKYGLTSGSLGDGLGGDSDDEDEPEIFTDESEDDVVVSSSEEDEDLDGDDDDGSASSPIKKPKQSAAHLAAAEAYLADVTSSSDEEDGDFEMSG